MIKDETVKGSDEPAHLQSITRVFLCSHAKHKCIVLRYAITNDLFHSYTGSDEPVHFRIQNSSVISDK